MKHFLDELKHLSNLKSYQEPPCKNEGVFIFKTISITGNSSYCLIETIDLNEIEVKERIKDEIQRFSKMQKFFLGIKEKMKIPDVDVRGYAKYILREGSDIEKRELLNCLKNKLLLKEKQISIETI